MAKLGRGMMCISEALHSCAESHDLCSVMLLVGASRHSPGRLDAHFPHTSLRWQVLQVTPIAF